MTVWCSLSTIKIFRKIAHILCILFVFIVFSTILFFTSPSFATSSNEVINFSARLKNSTGSVVDDGYYNIEFKLYNQKTEGEPVWSEIYNDTNGTSPEGDNRVRVVNGHFSVKLGSLQGFNSIDWTDSLWLTMNIGGDEQIADPEEIDWDGEMNPRIQLSATPYAMNANRLGGKTLDEILQLGQGIQNDTSNQASIAINKTGSGSLIHLQSNGSDIFEISQSGDITLGGQTDQSIAMGQAEAGLGHNLTLSAGAGADDGNSNAGGNLVLQGGDASGLNGKGGDVVIDAGTGANGGKIAIGTDNADEIEIGNEDSVTTINGDLNVDSIDTSDESALEIGGENATEINLNTDTNIKGDVSIASKKNSDSAFQIQNSANSTVLNVSTNGGNILTLGSGTGGVGNIGRVTSGTYGEDTLVSEQASIVNKTVPVGHTIIGSLSTAFNDNANLTVTDNKGNTYTIDESTSHGTEVSHYIFSSRISTPLVAGDVITFSIDGISDRWAWNVEEFDNIVTSSRLDQTSTNSGQGSTLSATTNGQTSDEHQLVFSGFSYNGAQEPTILSTDQFTGSAKQWTNGNGNNHGNYAQWRYSSEPGIETSAINADIDLEWTAIIATYKTLGERSTAGSIGLASLGGFTGSLNTSSLTADRTYSLPDEDGVICLQESANCGFAGLHSESAQEGSLWLTGGAKFGDKMAISTAEDSEQALQVQNSQGINQLTVDTANSIVRIGSSSESTTLLALDIKTTEDDPIGTNGAMYYSEDLGNFRCFESGMWKDCITPLPISVTAGGDTVIETDQPEDVEDLDFTLIANTKYYYKFVLMHESDLETTGVGFGVTTPNDIVSSNWCVNTSSTVDAANAGHWGSYCGMGDAEPTTTGEDGRGTNFTSTMEGYIETGEEGGELKLRMKSEHAESITTLKEGSFGLLQIVQ